MRYVIKKDVVWRENKKRGNRKISSFRAEDGAQTRDPQLGRLMLYQLSYFRKKNELQHKTFIFYDVFSSGQ